MVQLNPAGWLIAALTLAIVCAAAPGQVKAPVPPAAAQAESENRIREQFAEELSGAKSEGDRAALGRQLYRQSMQSSDDPVGRYVLLMLAKDMLAEAGETAAALAAVREAAQAYLIDDLALEQAVLQRAFGHGADSELLAEEALILTDRAADRDRFTIATAMVALAGEAGTSGEPYREMLDHVQSRREAFGQVAQALTALADNPEDPHLNLIVGEYRCFVQGRWDDGLPLLGRGSDPVLQRLAGEDLDGPRGRDQFLVAAEWWRVAESRPDQAKVIRTRAIHWYEQFQRIPGGIDRRVALGRILAEVDRVVAAAAALSADGLPLLAAHRLRKAAYLDPARIERAIEALGESDKAAAGIADPSLPEPSAEKAEVGSTGAAAPEPADHQAPQLYEGRAEGRSKLPDEARAAITAGLDWLRSHQDDDGMWDADEFMKHDLEGTPSDGAGSAVHDVGITSLALLAFLGDGAPVSDPDRGVVHRATTWLRAQQGENGLFGTDASHDFMYDHALATVGMCEAYALTGDAGLGASAQAGIDYLEAHRNPDSVWRYQPRSGKNDSTVTGWCVLAYRSAKDAGLKVNLAAMENAGAWYDSVTNDAGQVGYTSRGEISSRHPGLHQTQFPPDKGEALTAIGLSSRFLMGQDPKRTPVMVAAARTILGKPPVWNEADGSIDHYYWYHATSALRQMGGNYWKTWSSQLSGTVLDAQRSAGNTTGSWDPVGVWGADGGRVYSTALLILCLQGEYRYGDMLDVAPLRPLVGDLPLGRLFNRLRQAWSDDDYPRVDRAQRNLRGEELTEEERLLLERSAAMLAAKIEDAMKEIATLRSSDDYPAVYERLGELEEEFKGLDPGKEADEIMRVFMKDLSIRAEITAEQQLQSILQRLPADDDRARARLIRALEMFVMRRAYRDTRAAKKAQDLLDTLKKRR